MDSGNLAEWASVAVGAVGAAVVFLISKRTNELAMAANETNRKLASVEEQRDREESAIRKVEENLILISLSAMIGETSSSLGTAWQAAVFDKGDGTACSIINASLHTDFVIPDSIRSRVHFLEFNIAGQLVRLEGDIPKIKSYFQKFSSDDDMWADPSHKARIQYLHELSVVASRLHMICTEVKRKLIIPGDEPNPNRRPSCITPYGDLHKRTNINMYDIGPPPSL